MRAFFLLLIVAVAFLLVLRFYPTSDVEGAETEAAAQAETGEDSSEKVPTRFLTRPEPRETPAPVVPTTSEPEPEREATPVAQESAGDALPEWLADIEAIPVPAGNELALAAAVLHGEPADVERVVRGETSVEDSAVLRIRLQSDGKSPSDGKR